MSDSKPDPDLAGQGLSATGKTADQFSPGDDSPGGYGDPGGPGSAEQETTAETAQEDVGQSADGDAEGA